MTGKIVEILVAEGIAVLMFVFAYAIGVKQRMLLIAGYNERTAKYVTDKPALARLVGRVCLLVGIVTALMPLGTYLWGNTVAGWYMVIGHYGGFIIGVIAFTVLQSREYVVSSKERRRLKNGDR